VESAIEEIKSQISAIESSNFTIDSPIATKIYMPKKDASSSEIILQEILAILRNVSGDVIKLKESQEPEPILEPNLSEKERSILNSIKSKKLEDIDREIEYIANALYHAKKDTKETSHLLNRMLWLQRERTEIQKDKTQK
jgi:hypothetical protein